MATCPHNAPAGTRCIECGDLFNYEFAVALRRLWWAMLSPLPKWYRKRLGGEPSDGWGVTHPTDEDLGIG